MCFDSLLMLQSLSDHLTRHGFENLSGEHIQILLQSLDLDIGEQCSIPIAESASWG